MGNIQNVFVAPKEKPQQLSTSQPQPSMPYMPSRTPHETKLYEKLVDSEYQFFNKLTRLLYNAQLVKTDSFDPESPLAGYTLYKIMSKGEDGKEHWIPNVNHAGYQTLTQMCLLMLSDVVSTTSFDPKIFKANEFSIAAVMSVADMLCSNRHNWEFNNKSIIRPLGIAFWEVLYSVINRSYGRNPLMKMIFHPNVFGISNGQEEEKHSFKWQLPFGGGK